MQPPDLDLPVRLMAHERPFDEVTAALDSMLRQAHDARNYGAIVLLEGSRVSIVSHYGRPAAEQALALGNYLSMQPDPIACAAKVLTVCTNCPELVERFVPAAIVEVAKLPREPAVEGLLSRLQELDTGGQPAQFF